MNHIANSLQKKIVFVHNNGRDLSDSIKEKLIVELIKPHEADLINKARAKRERKLVKRQNENNR